MHHFDISTSFFGNPSSSSYFCDSSYQYLSDKQLKDKQTKPICLQYVNPTLLLQWEGDIKSQNQITGSGVFRVFQRQTDGYHNLQSEKWKNGIATGQVKMTRILLYSQNNPDNIVKQIRKFTGTLHNMMKQGYGEYIIQYYFSNQQKKIIQIKGTWNKDQIISATIIQNNKTIQNVNFINNISTLSNQPISLKFTSIFSSPHSKPRSTTPHPSNKLISNQFYHKINALQKYQLSVVQNFNHQKIPNLTLLSPLTVNLKNNI